MAQIVDRMIRAAKLDVTLYDEVERDRGSLGEAMTVVAISSVAAGVGSSLVGGPIGLIGGTLAALVGWFIWAVLVHFVGTKLMAEPGTQAELSDVLRVTGYSAAPGVIRVIAFIPLLGGLINLAAAVWMLVAMVVAVRQVLKYQSSGKAIAVCIVGWLIQMVIIGLFAMIGLGGALLVGAG